MTDKPTIENSENHISENNNTLNGLEQLLDEKVNKKISEHRDLEAILKQDHESFKSEIDRRLQYFLYILAFSIAVLSFVGYQTIRNFVQSQVELKLITPQIETSLDQAWSKKENKFIKDNIRPLETRTEDIKKSFDNLENELKKLEDISNQIKFIQKQVKSDAEIVVGLKESVKNQSATVNFVAKEASEAKKLVNTLSDKNLKAEQKLSQLDKSINEGNNAVKELQRYIKFNSAILSAQNDSRPAYDQLWEWSRDISFPFKKEAAQAVQTIMDQHNPAIVMSGFKIPWNEGVDPQKFSLPELWKIFQSAPPNIRPGILEFVWEKRADIPKKERLQFLVDVLKSDESLRVVEYAGRYFAGGTKDKFKPIAIHAHLKRWEENKGSIE